MQIVIVPDRDLIEDVLSRLEPRADVTAGGDGALRAASLPVFDAALVDTWQRLRTLVLRAAREGWQTVRAEVDGLVAYVEETAASLGKRATAFRNEILAKVHELIRETVDTVLRAMRSELTVGQHRFRLSSLELEQKLVFSASLEASIEAACQLLGSGELVVKGAYTFVEPGA
jgi:hypothetical protein